MKQLSIGLNIILVVLVGILFYLHFDGRNKSAVNVLPTKSDAAVNTATGLASSRIGYFEMDSLQANYAYFKDALTHLKEKEQTMNAELAGMEKDYQKKVTEWQKKGAAMSQAEADAAQRENAQLQQAYQVRKQSLEESFGKQSMEFKKDIKKRIEEYLKGYNKDKNYSYILSYEPDFIFLRDTTCNITPDLVKGLNAEYKKK
ncbi:MAG: OmpH family outer membrane protein [Chitinophagaceae bacterium]